VANKASVAVPEVVEAAEDSAVAAVVSEADRAVVSQTKSKPTKASKLIQLKI